MSDNVHSFYITLTSFSESDHFADVSKMIRNVHPCILTPYLCFVNKTQGTP